MESIALIWSYLVGNHKDLNIKSIRILDHGKHTKSLVKIVWKESQLLRLCRLPKFDIFKLRLVVNNFYEKDFYDYFLDECFSRLGYTHLT